MKTWLCRDIRQGIGGRHCVSLAARSTERNRWRNRFRSNNFYPLQSRTHPHKNLDIYCVVPKMKLQENIFHQISYFVTPQFFQSWQAPERYRAVDMIEAFPFLPLVRDFFGSALERERRLRSQTGTSSSQMVVVPTFAQFESFHGTSEASDCLVARNAPLQNSRTTQVD